MIVLFLLTIAVLLFIIAVFLNHSADSEEAKTITNSNKNDSPKTITRESFWEKFKGKYPSDAMTVERITHGSIKKMSDIDAKQLIASMRHTKETQNVTSFEEAFRNVMDMLKRCFNDTNQYTVIKMLDNVIETETQQTGRKRKNTLSYYAKNEINKYIEDVYAKMPPVELFKVRYKEALSVIDSKIEYDVHRMGPNSPLAQEAIRLMKAVEDDTTQMETALRFGYGSEFHEILWGETEAFIEENCDASIYDAFDYYNNPTDFVDSRIRCPKCGSVHVFNPDEDEDEMYCCSDCKQTFWTSLE